MTPRKYIYYIYPLFSPNLEVRNAAIINGVSVKVDNVQGNLETVYEDKDAPENGEV